MNDLAVRITKELVCDVCGSDKDVTRYRITRTVNSRTVSPDLCAKHAEDIESLFRKLPQGKRGQSRARPVLTEAQVRAKRIGTTKKAAKKTTTSKRS